MVVGVALLLTRVGVVILAFAVFGRTDQKVRWRPRRPLDRDSHQLLASVLFVARTGGHPSPSRVIRCWGLLLSWPRAYPSSSLAFMRAHA